MSTITRFMLLGTAPILLFTQVFAADDAANQKNEQRSVSLSDIVTTSSQRPLQAVRDVLQKKSSAQSANDYLRQLLASPNGCSNAFLVEAANIDDALSASFNVVIGSRSVDAPVWADTLQPTNIGNHWLVAYLGTGPSDPAWWTIESVGIGKDKVILRYRKSKPRPATEDRHRYYYWVPLGKLAPGAYEIQLFDAEQSTVTLMRRVDVH